MSDLEERMKEAGMMTIEEMLGETPIDHWMTDTYVEDLPTFEKWIVSKREEYTRMFARYTLDKKEDGEMYEWILAHKAVFDSVCIHFRKAISNE